MKYIEADKLKAEIERLYNDKSYSEDRWDMGYDCACEDIMSFLSTLESEEPDKSLEEAAEESGLEYAPIISGEALDLSGQFYETDDVDWPSRCGFIKGFKAGTKWQAEHAPLPEDTVIFQNGIAEGKRLMLEDAVEGFVATHLTSEGTKITVNSGYLPKEMCIKPGEKVRIIIVKEEKNGQSD